MNIDKTLSTESYTPKIVVLYDTLPRCEIKLTRDYLIVIRMVIKEESIQQHTVYD